MRIYTYYKMEEICGCGLVAFAAKKERLKREIVSNLDFLTGSVTSQGPSGGFILTHKQRGKTKSKYIRVGMLEHKKAETLRKRLIPGAREYNEVFAFIDFDGSPTNNHAERSLRPLVIFRKTSMGTRSQIGSENITLFASILQTAKLQASPAIPVLSALLTGTPAKVRAAVFGQRHAQNTS